MSATTDIAGDEFDLSTTYVRNVSWINNLLNGACALLWHPFLPLYESNFIYNCLFSDKSYCYGDYDCRKSKLQTEYPSPGSREITPIAYISDLFKSIVGRNSIPSEFHVNNQTGGAWISRTISQVKTNLTFGRTLLITQLIVCTIILGRYLVNDIRVILRLERTKRSRQD